MASIQQSIEINVPVHAAYQQLTQFEDYPLFMEEVEAVRRLDDRHLHWTTMLSNRPVEWDAEIIEQEPDRCIAWRNTSGPTNTARVEVQPAGADASHVTLTWESLPEQVPGSSAGYSEVDMTRRLKLDLARLKDFIEGRGAESGAWQAQAPTEQDTTQDRNAGMHSGSDAGQQGKAPVPTSSYAAGSEGWDGNEEPSAPVTSAPKNTGQQGKDAAAAEAPQPSAERQTSRSTKSDYLLSPSSADEIDEGPFSVSEEVSLDQQSDAVRHVGQMPQDTSLEHGGETPVSDAMGKAMQQDRQSEKEQAEKDDAKLKRSIDRAVPPSE